MVKQTSTVLALDVGGRRIGVALASLAARLPAALTTLEQGKQTLVQIQQLVNDHQAVAVVVGLPRGLEGQETEQTRNVRNFVSQLKAQLSVPIHFQDEAVTSVNAEAELHARGVAYNKGDVDALAALYILDDFLSSHQGEL